MRIDPKTLPPAAQAQIAKKLLQNQREKAANRAADGLDGKRKYHTPLRRARALRAV